MPFVFRISVVVVLFAVHAYSVFWTTMALVGESARWRWYAVYYAGYSVVMWGVVLLMIALDVLAEDWLEPLGLSIVALIFSAILRLRYRVPMAAALGAAMLGHFLIYTIFDFLTAAASYYSPVFDGKYLYVATSLLLPYMLTLLFSGGIVFVLNRSEFAQYFAYLFHGRMRTAVSLLVFFLLMNLKALLDRFFPGVTTDFSYGLFCCVLILFALFCIQFGAMYAASRDKVKAQEETIAQQQAHMALLEELQGEIRAFRHDFTNLLSGMALSAQEGDVEAIQEFMRRTSGYFDEKLGSEIRQMEGLSNIRIYPVRSLISTKLNLMRQRHIQVALEIMNPVTGVRMSTEDLLRCQGILLDNAIEAASKSEGKIRVVLLQDAGELYIAVANNYDEQPNLAALTKSGYTTKGKGHGTGLSSYRKMVSRCPDCMTRTYIKDDYLVQELRIPV